MGKSMKCDILKNCKVYTFSRIIKVQRVSCKGRKVESILHPLHKRFETFK